MKRNAAAFRWLAAAAGFLFGFAVLAVLVHWHCADGVDQWVRSIVFQPGSPGFQSLMQDASFWGGQPGQMVVICAACGIFWYRGPRWALGLPFITVGAAGLQLLMKWAFNRPRPNLDPWGFPSGHVLSLVVLLGCIAYVVAASGARRPWRWLSLASCALIVCTVAYSRMYLDAHWLSDVLGGLTIGLAYLFVTIWLHASGATGARSAATVGDLIAQPELTTAVITTDCAVSAAVTADIEPSAVVQAP